MNLEYYWSKILKKLRGISSKNSVIHNTSKLESGTSFINSSIDKHSFCGYDCQINNCKIGSYTSISNNVVIGGGRHPMEWVGMSPVFYEGRDSIRKKFSSYKRDNAKEVIIGNDVWIGEKVLISQGVTIGSGSVIGMGSIVTKDVKPYSIVAGSPAKLIRMRFDPDVIEELLEISWWDFDEKKLENFAKFIKEPRKFIEKVKE